MSTRSTLFVAGFTSCLNKVCLPSVHPFEVPFPDSSVREGRTTVVVPVTSPGATIFTALYTGLIHLFATKSSSADGCVTFTCAGHSKKKKTRKKEKCNLIMIIIALLKTKLEMLLQDIHTEQRRKLNQYEIINN